MRPVLFVSAWICCTLNCASAGTIVNSSLSLTHLQILPSSGTPLLVSTSVDPVNGGVSSSAFAYVYNSLGEADPEFNSTVDGAVTATSNVTWASATSSADGTAPTASAVSSVNLPSEESAWAGTQPGCCNGNVSGFFEIMDSSGTSNPVSVSFSAALSIDQSLSTDAFGLSASSETTFSFQVNADDTSGMFLGALLFQDTPLALTGPDQSAAYAASPTLMATAALLTNTEYPFVLETDSESYAAESTPEPGSFLLCAGAAWAAAAVLRRRSRPA